MLSKTKLKQKKGVKLTKKLEATAAPDRETMMYLPPEHHDPNSTRHHHDPQHEEHTHHSDTVNTSGVPEGYYRCSHGCLCRKGMVHQPNYVSTPGTGGQGDHGEMHRGAMHGGSMHGGGMQGGYMGQGQMQGSQMGMYPNAMGMSPMGNMMNTGMNPMAPKPPPKANFGLINKIGQIGNGIIGGMGQAMDISMGMNQQFNNVMQRNFFILF